MPGVGVTAFDSAVALSVVPTNRLSSKVYTVSLVRPVTVYPSSFAPPSALLGMSVQVAG